MRAAALLLALGLAGPAAGADGTETWLGHTWVGSERTLPVIGTVQTRTDTWVLARVERDGDTFSISQEPCELEIKSAAGVRVSMSPDAVPHLPVARFVLRPGADGVLQAGPWSTGWGSEDVDQDGDPGVTIRVRAMLCGGHLQVASLTESRARASETADGLEGTLDVRVGQQILGASGACLKLAASDSVEELRGRFRYARVPDGTTCTTLPRDAWPVADDSPRAAPALPRGEPQAAP